MESKSKTEKRLTRHNAELSSWMPPADAMLTVFAPFERLTSAPTVP